jgi:hypothetical protein
MNLSLKKSFKGQSQIDVIIENITFDKFHHLILNLPIIKVNKTLVVIFDINWLSNLQILSFITHLRFSLIVDGL